MPDNRHCVVAVIPFDGNKVASLSDCDDGRVSAPSRRVNPNDDRRCEVVVPLSSERIVHHTRRDELIVALGRELTVDLNFRLRAVFAVLGNNLSVDLFVRSFNCARVDVLGLPKISLAVEAFKEVALIAPGVAEREPVAVEDVLCEKARSH